MDIKEALERISVDYVDTEISEKSTAEGTLELEFNKNTQTGLVFEDDTEKTKAQLATAINKIFAETFGTDVYDEDLEEEETYEITGSMEANAMENKISNESPVGKALMKGKVGDVVKVLAPEGEYKLAIKEIF